MDIDLTLPCCKERNLVAINRGEGQAPTRECPIVHGKLDLGLFFKVKASRLAG
jgi:hypothetical protein